MYCSICSKQLFTEGYKSFPNVCSSCSLTKSKELVKGGKKLTPRTIYDVRMKLNETLKKSVVEQKVEHNMAEISVRSNYARNRTILLSNNQTITFNAEGIAKLPSHLLEVFEKEMANKPGRYSFVEEPISSVVGVLDVGSVEVTDATLEEFKKAWDRANEEPSKQLTLPNLSVEETEEVSIDEEYLVPEQKNSKSSKKKK